MRSPSRRLALASLAALALPARADAALTLHIDMRPAIAAGLFDPARDGVGLRGAVAPLSWNATLPATRGDESGWWRVVLRWPQPPGQPVPYKIKIERPGQPDAGWEPGRNHVLAAPAAGGERRRAWGDEALPLPPQRTGRIDRIAPLPSRHVQPREVQVWLPPGYDEQVDRRYPVLLMHDGQNVFDATAAGAEWQLDEHADALVRAGAIAPLIIVGVASGDSRVEDYTPYAHELGGRTRGGGAAAYARYLVDELKPLIATRYRTLEGPAHWTQGGSSLGGLLALWLLLTEPRHFGAGWVLSPSVFWGGEAILADLARLPASAAAPRVWLEVGGTEAPAMVQGARRLRDALAARGWPVQYTEVPGAGHDEIAWAARVPALLKALHGRAAGRP